MCSEQNDGSARMKSNVQSMEDFLDKCENKTFIIAEIGTNHNGNFSVAKEMISKAASAGVDAVKLQIFRTEKFFTKTVPAFPRAKLLGYERQFDRFKDLELSDEQVIELSEFAKKEKVVFLSTPFDNDSVDFLDALVPVFKIASADLINFQLLRHVASKNKPIILSTGQATVEEIERCVNIFSKDQLALLHCVSSYPTPDDQVNLGSIVFLKKRFNLPTGYSDHSIGVLACIASVAIGARIIEKHFTLDKKQKFGDHPLSADPEEMRLLISEVRRLEKMLGAEEKKCQTCELESKKQLRRSLHLKRDVKAGTVLDEDMIIPLVSGIGITADKIDEVTGKKIARSMKSGDVLKLEDLS